MRMQKILDYLNLGNNKLPCFKIRFMKSLGHLMCELKQGLPSGKYTLIKETYVYIDKYNSRHDAINDLSGTDINSLGNLERPRLALEQGK